MSKLLYIPDGIYVTYCGTNILSKSIIVAILNDLTTCKNIKKYKYFLRELSLPVRGNFLASEFEVIEDD